MGQYDAAIDMLDRRQAELQRRIDLANSLDLPLQIKMGETLSEYGETLLERFQAEEDRKSANALQVLGKAGEFLDQALAIQKDVLGERHSQTAMTIMRIGCHHLANGCHDVVVEQELDLAIKMLTRALTIQKDVLGERHRDTARTRLKLGIAYRHRGNFNLAIMQYTKALSIQKALLGERHPDVAETMVSIGCAQWSRMDLSGAITQFTEAVSIRRATLGERHSLTAGTAEDLRNLRRQQTFRILMYAFLFFYVRARQRFSFFMHAC